MTEVTYLMDVHVPRVITDELRSRNIPVLTAQEEGYDNLDDDEILEYADEKGQVVFTLDTDFLKESKQFLQEGRSHSGIIYTHLLQINIGECIKDLELIAEEKELEDLADQMIFLPL